MLKRLNKLYSTQTVWSSAMADR